MATTKKTATKKTAKKTAKKAAKKTATKTAKKTAKKKIIRGGSARLSARATSAGVPPHGPIDAAAVDREVERWTSQAVKTRRDFVEYSTRTILDDAVEMRAGVEDLAAFRAVAAPIDERDFAWLGHLVDALVLVGDDAEATAAARKTLSREAEVGIAAVRARRTQLSRLAQAAGVSASLLAIKGGNDDPAAILAGADKVVRQAHRAIDTFHDRAVALRLIGALDEAAEQLRAVVYGKESAALSSSSTHARRAALKRVTYDVLTHIGPWGLAAIGDDPTKEKRYRLDHIFARANPASAPADDPVDGG
jgi:hypothetical protein